MKNKIKFKKFNLTIDKLYFILSISLVVLSAIIIAVSNGESFKNLFWHGATVGYFPDLFESVIHTRTSTPYEYEAIYPAFVYCLIYFFNYFIPGEYSDHFNDLARITN